MANNISSKGVVSGGVPIPGWKKLWQEVSEMLENLTDLCKKGAFIVSSPQEVDIISLDEIEEETPASRTAICREVCGNRVRRCNEMPSRCARAQENRVDID